MKLYIFSKFDENIDARFKVIEWIRLEINNFKGALFCKNVAKVKVLILYTSSDAALYLYQVS